ncbi:MAG: RimJ/RimL family protein N-acetyltransferase [Anaerolineaceae bacterium]|nr:RimJ/RimL family protein N-acetyltransferase [Anaerolineaceae bacterium]
MIFGKRVRLRGVEKKDIEQFVVWLNDPDVRNNLLIYWPMTLWEEEEWFEGLKKRESAEKPLAIEVNTPDGWQLIGNSGFHQVDWKNSSAEVGIFIGDKDYWNQGYGSDAMRLLLKYGFNSLNLNRIYLHVFDTNPRAIRAYEKVGFVHEGRLRQDIFLNGSYVDVLMMSVLRSEWTTEK